MPFLVCPFFMRRVKRGLALICLCVGIWFDGFRTVNNPLAAIWRILKLYRYLAFKGLRGNFLFQPRYGEGIVTTPEFGKYMPRSWLWEEVLKSSPHGQLRNSDGRLMSHQAAVDLTYLFRSLSRARCRPASHPSDHRATS